MPAFLGPHAVPATFRAGGIPPGDAVPRCAALVLNPAAGTLAGVRDPADLLSAALAAAGYRLVVPARPDLSLDAQLDAALAHRAEVVFACGGDGTLRAVAARIAGSGVIFGVLPGGTMNRLAGRLGLPADPAAAARRLAKAVVTELPLAEANGQPFLYQAVIGRASRLVRFREMQRGAGVLGWVPLLRAGLRLALRPPGRSLRLRLRRGCRPHRADVVVATVAPPGAAPALRIEAVRRRGLLGAIGQAWCWVRGRLAAAPEVTAHECGRLAVQGTARHLRVTLDGELTLMSAPLRIRLRPEGLRVLRPAAE